MANPSEKGNHYFLSVFNKAWEDISLIEAITEGIVGLIIAAILLYEGFFDMQNTLEAMLDSFLFAVLFPIVYVLDTLYGILLEEKIKHHDGIVRYSNFADCLPETNPVSNVTTEIWFQTQTNLDFKIVISGVTGDLPFNPIQWDTGALNISSKSGNFHINREPGGSAFVIFVNVPDYSDSKTIFLPDDPREFIKHCLKNLVGGQIDYLYKSGTNILDKNQ